ncbi:hypothetical protein DVA80_21285, partial [Acinetobacter baumannii]|uniref:hypothetical protein n=1 Tax=Acinetobacter baumannii TaxID=470 RepID=UPI000DFC8104
GGWFVVVWLGGGFGVGGVVFCVFCGVFFFVVLGCVFARLVVFGLVLCFVLFGVGGGGVFCCGGVVVVCFWVCVFVGV